MDSPRRDLWYLSMTVSNISSSTETWASIGGELFLTVNGVSNIVNRISSETSVSGWMKWQDKVSINPMTNSSNPTTEECINSVRRPTPERRQVSQSFTEMLMSKKYISNRSRRTNTQVGFVGSKSPIVKSRGSVC